MASFADACALIEMGFRVFPIASGKRAPPLVEFTTQATRDVAVAAAYWPAGTDFNIGIAGGEGLFFVDIDAKKGKQGPAEYAALGGDFDRMVFATPSGGYHIPFLAPEDLGQAKVSPGIDIRAKNGYIVGPGSRLDGSEDGGIVGEYRILKHGVIGPPMPGLAAKLTPYRERKARPAEDAPDMDDARSVADALHYLMTRAPIAVEGLNGDDTTYRVACAVRRDFGLSNERAYQLLADAWNPRCVPPWPLEDLWAKVCHAEEYGTGAEGALSTARTLGKLVATSIASIYEKPGVWQFGNAIPEAHQQARDWIMMRLLLRKALTALVAPGSAGKSTFLLVLAALGAVGRGLTADMLCQKPFASVIYDAEEPREELSKRLAAICHVLRLEWDAVAPQVMLLGVDDLDFSLASGSPGQWAQNAPLVDQLVAAASAPQVGMIGLGPLNKLSSLDVGDNTAMSWFMKLLTQIAVRSDTALIFTHHASKDAERKGNVDQAHSALGAQSIISSVRISYTLSPLSETDLLNNRIPEHEAARYVRLNDGKMNLTLRGAAPVILHRPEYRLKSGDMMGALVPWQRQGGAEDETTLAQAVFDSMVAAESGRVGLSQAVARWQQIDAHKAQVSHDALIKRAHLILKKKSNRLFHRDGAGIAHCFTLVQDGRRSSFVYADDLTQGV